MKNILKNSLRISAMTAACILTLASCDDWTEPESLDIKTPSPDAGVYNDYLENLKVYKAGTHKAVFVTVENPDEYPASQSQHLTTLPDSVDFISLINADNLHPVIAKEMNDVRKKGTRVIYNINYPTFETEWIQKLKEDSKGELTEEDALAYFTERTEQMLALCDKYGYDGLTFTYQGRSLVSLPEEGIPAYDARQKSFLDPITVWKQAHPEKTISFIGNPQFLLEGNRAILATCDYIIVNTDNASNPDDLTVKVLAAASAGDIPSDRLIVTCETTRPNDEKKLHGYFSAPDEDGNPLRSVYGCALWAAKNSPSFTRAGILIRYAQWDYFNTSLVYRNIREAIGIMNPSPKN